MSTTLAFVQYITLCTEESLSGSPIACLGNEGRLMQRRLQQFLGGHLVGEKSHF